MTVERNCPSCNASLGDIEFQGGQFGFRRLTKKCTNPVCLMQVSFEETGMVVGSPAIFQLVPDQVIRVYRFMVYDGTTDQNVFSQRWATRAFIENVAQGKILEHTQKYVCIRDLDSNGQYPAK